MISENDPHVVVGAGLPGIAASLALARAGFDVVLIDSAPEIGGLLRSYEVEESVFDFGTHFANRTGIDDLDELLFGGVESEWVEFPVLRAGNVLNGVFNGVSDNPNLNALGQAGHDRCLAELLAAPGWSELREPNTAREYLLSEFGFTLVEKFFDPVLKKFTGLSSDALHYQANLLFNLKRFGVLDASATTELKRSDRYDARVAFHHRDHFSGHRACLYPRTGGMGKWIEQLEAKLKTAGVRVITGASIEYVHTTDGRVTGLAIDGREIKLNTLIWSVAPAHFCRMAGCQLSGPKPAMRSTVLAGLVFDQPFLTDCHYVTVFDPEYSAFRVTFYPNFRPHAGGRYEATVEFMIDPEEVTSRDWLILAEAELRRMGMIGDGTKVLARHEKVVWNGFPVQTNEMVAGTAAQADVARGYANVNLIGRASGEGWFLDSLIRQAYSVALDVACRSPEKSNSFRGTTSSND